MATAVLGSRVRKGSARPFIGVGEGEGELGTEQLGQGAKLGEDADSARGSAIAMAWQAGARVAAVQRQESWCGASLGAARVVWPWRGHASGQVAASAYGVITAPPRRERKIEGGERYTVNGIFVIRSKFKTQFCKLKFSPFYLPQMKNF